MHGRFRFLQQLTEASAQGLQKKEFFSYPTMKFK